MSSKRWITLTAAAVLMLAGCGGSPASDWTSGEDVVDGLKAAGVPCLASANEPEVDRSASDRGIAFVQCDGFGVMLITDRNLYGTVENCAGTEQLDWDQADKQRVIVGENFVITPVVTGTEAIPAFPAEASAEDLIDAFGGEEVSVTDWMTQQGCVRPASTTAPAPASS